MILSICIPTYNKVNQLDNCLNSILISKKNVDNFNFEICISDNNSDENTEEIYEIAIREGYDIDHNTVWRSQEHEPAYLEEVKKRYNFDEEELELRKSNISTWHEIISKVNELYDSGPIF